MSVIFSTPVYVLTAVINVPWQFSQHICGLRLFSAVVRNHAQRTNRWLKHISVKVVSVKCTAP